MLVISYDYITFVDNKYIVKAISQLSSVNFIYNLGTGSTLEEAKQDARKNLEEVYQGTKELLKNMNLWVL
jgi:GTP cyclohydrolase III